MEVEESCCGLGEVRWIESREEFGWMVELSACVCVDGRELACTRGSKGIYTYQTKTKKSALPTGRSVPTIP